MSRKRSFAVHELRIRVVFWVYLLAGHFSLMDLSLHMKDQRWLLAHLGEPLTLSIPISRGSELCILNGERGMLCTKQNKLSPCQRSSQRLPTFALLSLSPPAELTEASEGETGKDYQLTCFTRLLLISFTTGGAAMRQNLIKNQSIVKWWQPLFCKSALQICCTFIANYEPYGLLLSDDWRVMNFCAKLEALLTGWLSLFVSDK